MKKKFDSNELREMMLSHKDWAVVFFVEADDMPEGGGYYSWVADEYSCEEGEVLDCDTDDIVPRGRTYFSRKQFRYEVKKYMSHTSRKYLTDEEIDEEVDRICSEYEPYWKKAIIVSVTT